MSALPFIASSKGKDRRVYNVDTEDRQIYAADSVLEFEKFSARPS